MWDPVRRIAKHSYPLTKYSVLRKLERAKGTPLVVFTMSKTASTAIYSALIGLVPPPVLKAHMVSPDALAHAEQTYRKTDPSARPTHLFHGFHLSRHLPTPANPWLVVTIVRDPIARAASDFFQSGQRSGRLQDPSTAVKQFEMFVRDTGVARAVNWFDREFKRTLGIDIYAHPFDPANGCGVIDLPHARILMLRQESLDAAPVALARFLQIPGPVKIAKENVGSRKDYKDIYAQVLRDARFSPETLDAAYGSRLVRHFYLADEIAMFRRRWESETAEIDLRPAPSPLATE